MSGIVALVRFDGAPIDGDLLRAMTREMRPRGPDGEAVWIGDAAGLGHALLATGRPDAEAAQPLTLDGSLWIAADARLDGRRDLIASLRGHAREVAEDASDAALLLHAYGVWHDRCVDHLLGDFAFAIWDATARRLFAARDHFGVKPLYYAEVTGGCVLSNTLRCVRMHPEVSERLADAAVADFLLFGLNEDPATTIFADVRKVEPASAISCAPGRLRHRRYWNLPTGGCVRYRDPQEYVDRFHELFQAAVVDRLSPAPTGIWMSGGLDSTAIAAVAQRAGGNAAARLAAHTVVYDALIPDEERAYAGRAARALGLPIEFFVADGYLPLGGWERTDLQPPEPIDDPFLLMRHDLFRRAAEHGRVWLGGDGGDEVLRGSYVSDLIGRMPLRAVAAGAVDAWRHGRRPGFGIRASLRKRLARSDAIPPLPSWINPAFARRLDLRDRYRQILSTGSAGSHTLRPEARARLATAQWSASFEAYDPGATGTAVEYRTPFLDVRLVEWALAIPPLPWCVDKHLLRTAVTGLLPESVRCRPKTPLAIDPLRAHLDAAPPAPRMVDLPDEVAQYVDISAFTQEWIRCIEEPWTHLRPLYLGAWLRGGKSSATR